MTIHTLCVYIEFFPLFYTGYKLVVLMLKTSLAPPTLKYNIYKKDVHILFNGHSLAINWFITHYMTTYKTIYVYFSYITYLISHVTSLNNICDGLISYHVMNCNKPTTNRFVTKLCSYLIFLS